MFKTLLGALIAATLIASPSLAAEKKKPRPQLTSQVLDGMQACQENIIRLKAKSLRIPQRVAVRVRPGIPRG